MHVFSQISCDVFSQISCDADIFSLFKPCFHGQFYFDKVGLLQRNMLV